MITTFLSLTSPILNIINRIEHEVFAFTLKLERFFSPFHQTGEISQSHSQGHSRKFYPEYGKSCLIYDTPNKKRIRVTYDGVGKIPRLARL